MTDSFILHLVIMEVQRINETLQKLIQRRGYNVPSSIPMTVHFTVHRPKDKDILLIYRFAEDTRVGIGVIRDIVKLMEQNNAVNAILLADGITSSAQGAMKTLVASGRFIIQIPLSSLMYDIYEHRDVPHHRLLDRDEATAFLESRQLVRSNLPCIRMDDPMCRYLGGHPDDIFEITRIRPTVGRDIYYRRVINTSLE